MHGSLTEVRQAKRGPGLSGKQGVGKLTMHNWNGDGPGCYLVANIMTARPSQSTGTGTSRCSSPRT
eukprot:6977268-Prymnesium_polylepis.1